MIDFDDVPTAIGTLALVILSLAAAIYMDARKLPLGRVKMMPWTTLSIFLMLATLMAGRNLLLDVIR